MAIHWDDLEILAALDRLEGEDRAYTNNGENLVQEVAAGRPCSDQDRASFVRLLLSMQGASPPRLAFEQMDYRGARQPQPHEHEYLQSLWRFQLTERGRDRARGRVILEGLPDPDTDDGRLIPFLVLEKVAGFIAGWYSLEQMPRFFYDSGLPQGPFDVPPADLQKETYAYNLLGSLATSGPEERRLLRRFIADLLNGALDIVLDTDQHHALTTALAKAGWYVEGDTIVIGERNRSPLPVGAGERSAGLGDLHPLISDAAGDLWYDGHRREAIGRAAVALLAAVRDQSGLDGDGQDLMARAFRLEDPRIIVADLQTETGRNLQCGTHMIAMGSVAAVRNPASHTLADHDEAQAREQLAILSFIARRLDEAQLAPLESSGSS